MRPQYILSTLETLAHTNCAVAAIVLYTWVTPERNPSDSEDWYGIHAPSGAGTTATAAFADGLRKAAEPAPAIPLCRSG